MSARISGLENGQPAGAFAEYGCVRIGRFLPHKVQRKLSTVVMDNTFVCLRMNLTVRTIGFYP
jgi:hypothetical protein